MGKLQLKSMKKSFGDTEVIRNVDLMVEDGEFIVFVGPSGCGKSTLLRMIAGLETADSGAIEIDGTDVSKSDPSKRGIAMVFQTYALYPHMTVEENMAFGLEMAGMPQAERKQLVEKTARTLHLEPYLKRKPKQLSGGQRQRVAIGRAIVRDPKIFLFDEPLSNLDAELRVRMRIEIAKLHADLGATMIYVTHDQVEAMTLASRIVVLRDGRIEQVGTPLELYSDPDNAFVAGFIGSPKMNFVPATMTGRTEAGGVILNAPDLGIAGIVVMPRDANSEMPQQMVVGIRPEHFLEPDTAGSVNVSLTPEVIEHLGGVSYVYTDAGRDTSLIAEVRGKPNLKVASELQLSIRPADCLLFDGQGRRL
ncbi:sn-glycerol-3-phosphate ABC transporter ATP-binding protein UgpC [Rhizobium sp. S96]|uniref:ABC transporter ATP-binding protein n=1 Tax=Rhizobium sp. S96 TaxID=3055140 RepID=UPI0025AB2CBC|nr:sn-glycerol-3-phosphate ABC transporter ATP-binding protein UgpC [Rhizobium sp. S96]MDM9623223.1 sn-glycerol-3-phosphate ABC transporter ATP-binding protein UgpC [Rhizobium sp. S96]